MKALSGWERQECRRDSKAKGGAHTIHRFARSGLKHRTGLPSEEPSVIVLPENPSGIVGEHWSNRTSTEQRPGICSWVVNLAIFASVATAPRTSNGEDSSIWECCWCLVPSGDIHGSANRPAIRQGIIYTCLASSIAARYNSSPISIYRHSRAKHIMCCIDYITFAYASSGRIIGCSICVPWSTNWESTYSVWSECHDLPSVMSYNSRSGDQLQNLGVSIF